MLFTSKSLRVFFPSDCDRSEIVLELKMKHSRALQKLANRYNFPSEYFFSLFLPVLIIQKHGILMVTSALFFSSIEEQHVCLRDKNF